MAKKEWRNISGDFDKLLRRIESGILSGSVSATLEGKSDFTAPDGAARCSVRVFERYSAAGKNRVSLNVTVFQAGGSIHVSAIASGGSQALFFKFNTFGEEAFLKKLTDLIRR